MNVAPMQPKIRFRRPASRLVMFAASAGAFDVLRQVLGALPSDFPAAIAIVLHRSPAVQIVDPLVAILRRWTALRVEQAEVGARALTGTVYVAPRNHHLVVTPGGRFGIVDGGRVRGVRSSANPLFETAAEVFGKNAIGVVLSGGDSDGTDGVQSVATAGGTVLVQDPECCQVPNMPASAIATGAVRYILPVEEIAAELQRLVAAR